MESLEQSRMKDVDGRLYFERPFAGAQLADHPVFERLTQVVPGHLTPAEVFSRTFGELARGTLSVLSAVFPVNRQTVRDNAAQKEYPAPTWMLTRQPGHDAVIDEAGRFLEVHLNASRCIGTVYVCGAPFFAEVKNAHGHPVTNWSERHVAYACGLGTFSLTRGLITGRGVAHRLVSWVVEAEVDRYGCVSDDPFAHCLHLACSAPPLWGAPRGEKRAGPQGDRTTWNLAGKKCGACIARCPGGAITETGHSLDKCIAYRRHIRAKYGDNAKGCALCMTGVPCTSKNPTPRAK
jgi:epoxyqueuosine reductase QueG